MKFLFANSGTRPNPALLLMHSTSRRPTNLLLLLWLLFSPFLIANTNAEPAFALTLTNFVDFVKEPPAIDTLIFRRILYGKPRRFSSKSDAEKFISEQSEKSLSLNTSDLLFALRYESPDNFIFQQIDSPTNAWSKSTRLKTFAGRGEGVWWDLTKNGAISTDSTNGIYQLNGADNDTFPIIFRFATELLHLGMLDLQPESIQENTAHEPRLADEIHFIGRTMYGGRIDGMAKASNGVISEIQYKILNQEGTIQGRTIQIMHKDGNLQSVEVSNVVKERSLPVLYCRYEVVSISMSTGSGPVGSCSVNQFLAGSDREVLIKKTGEMLNLRKGMRPVINHRADGLSSRTKRLIIIILFIGTLGLPLSLIWARGSKKTQLKKQPN